VGDVLDTYMGWYRTERPTTYKRAVSALKRFRVAFDNAPAESLSGDAIELWAASEAAQGQAEKALKLARAALKRAVAKRRIAHSPMAGVVIPKSLTSRAPPYYARDQLRELARQPRGAAWIFMAATGLRRGEMVKAQRADVREGMLAVESLPEGRTKSGKWRVVPLNPYALRALDRLGDGPLVACHADTLGDWFKADARAAGLPGSLHWLRHTFCTVLAQQGVSLHEIKRLAGHSSITVTEKYAHHAPDFGRPAVGTMAAWGRGGKHRKKHTRP
jgi:integrase